MTAARTAEVTVEVSFKISDRMTEGEMVDFAHAAIRDLNMQARLHASGASCETRIIATRVTTTSVGGSL